MQLLNMKRPDLPFNFRFVHLNCSQWCDYGTMLRFFVNNMSRLDSCSQNEFEVMIFLLLSRDIYFSSQTTKLLSDV